MRDTFYLRNLQNNIATQFARRSLLSQNRSVSSDSTVLLSRCQDVSLSFTFATQKSMKTTSKHVANLSSCRHSRTRIFIHLIYLYLGLWDIRTRSVHSVVRFCLAENATLIMNSISISVGIFCRSHSTGHDYRSLNICPKQC